VCYNDDDDSLAQAEAENNTDQAGFHHGRELCIFSLNYDWLSKMPTTLVSFMCSADA